MRPGAASSWQTCDLAVAIPVSPYNLGLSDLKRSLEPLVRKTQYWKTPFSHNRVWNHDGELAEQRFRRFAARVKPKHWNFAKLRVLSDIFRERRIAPVFVLTPIQC